MPVVGNELRARGHAVQRPEAGRDRKILRVVRAAVGSARVGGVAQGDGGHGMPVSAVRESVAALGVAL